MACTNLTAQHLARLYEEFCGTEVTFNAQVIIESGLVTSDVRLTVGSHHLPMRPVCLLHEGRARHRRDRP